MILHSHIPLTPALISRRSPHVHYSVKYYPNYKTYKGYCGTRTPNGLYYSADINKVDCAKCLSKLLRKAINEKFITAPILS